MFQDFMGRSSLSIVKKKLMFCCIKQIKIDVFS
jgi:hypothetical protein